MKREVWGISIGDNQLATALSNAQKIKVIHTVRQVAVPVSQTTPQVKKQFAQNFTADSKDVDRATAYDLQQFLISQGFLDEKYLTGQLGPRTKQAVILFQKANAISPANGYVGELTRQKINSLII
jgi:peptidoglycan hydrolase-like protein with peptidoglycan-binding domain